MFDQVESIYRAIEFIESHLHEDIDVAGIADATGYSLFHFMRKFNQMVHHTPYDYLMRRRLSEAAKLLIQSDLRIIDIGQDFCFNDQETFSRVFRKMFQMTPSQCRKGKIIESYRLMPTKTIDDLQFINGRHFKPPSIATCNEMYLLGLMTALSEDEKETNSQREKILADLTAECQTPLQSKLYELEFQINPQAHSLYYFAGMEESLATGNIPNLVRQKVGRGRYVEMDVPESQISLAKRYIYSTWIAGSGLTIKSGMLMLRWSYSDNENEQIKTIMIPVEQ